MSLQEAITRFRGRLRGTGIEPQDAAYEEAKRVYNGMIDRKPRLIVKCTDVADAIAAVRIAIQRMDGRSPNSVDFRHFQSLSEQDA